MMKNIDFVFVEFDDCLYLHKEHWEKEEDFDYYFDFASNNKKYKDSCLNLRLLEKLDKLKNKKCEHNVRVIMLTTSCISKQFEDKILYFGLVMVYTYSMIMYQFQTVKTKLST